LHRTEVRGEEPAAEDKAGERGEQAHENEGRRADITVVGRTERSV
jgi:hypothetical protein